MEAKQAAGPAPTSRHRAWWAVALAIALLLAMAVTVNVASIYRADEVVPWRQWIDTHAWHFFIWRLCLYGVIAAAWPWARRRRLQREPGTAPQLRRLEVLGFAGIVLSEASNWLHLH